MRRIAIFIVAYLLWCGLAWPYDQNHIAADGTGTAWDTGSLLLGLGVALLVAILFGGALTNKPKNLFNPLHIFWVIVYLPVFFYYCIKANLQVVYLVLHPDMPIKPGIVKVKTKLTSESGVTALANSITLTPGTLTVDVVNDNELYVHWLVVESAEEDKATEIIVNRFEYFLEKIFD
ncbi:MAG: Na+/H+ antiporter subunit E [Phycisphaerae bacterium]|nr:Na+/H+ antiporter subunit E [Phycisphaerae bacterium]